MVSYACKPNVGCYSKDSPETNAVFEGIQRYLNRYAQGVGFKLLQVDGTLGPATATAASKVATMVPQAGVSAALKHLATQMQPFTRDYQVLAQYAEDFLKFLEQGATEIGLAPVADPPKPVAVTPSPSPIVVAPPFTLPSPPAHPTKKYVIAGVGALLAGIALVGVYRVATKGARSTAVGGAARLGPPPWWKAWEKVEGSADYQSPDGWRARYKGTYGGHAAYKVYDPKNKLVSVGGIVATNGRHII